MLYDQNELFIELNKTLDQLLANAKSLQSPMVELLAETEVVMLQKMQESLAAHFLHTKGHITSKKQSRVDALRAKALELKAIAPELYALAELKEPKTHIVGNRPRIGRNRKRLKLSEVACSF